jgi:hypothetical protein
MIAVDGSAARFRQARGTACVAGDSGGDRDGENEAE